MKNGRDIKMLQSRIDKAKADIEKHKGAISELELYLANLEGAKRVLEGGKPQEQPAPGGAQGAQPQARR